MPMPNEACRRVPPGATYAAESLGLTREMLLSGKGGREKPSPGIEGVRKNSARTPALRNRRPPPRSGSRRNRDFVALDREGGEAGVGDEAVLHFLVPAR